MKFHFHKNKHNIHKIRKMNVIKSLTTRMNFKTTNIPRLQIIKRPIKTFHNLKNKLDQKDDWYICSVFLSVVIGVPYCYLKLNNEL